MELITIVRDGLLCFRSIRSASEAEVANEIFTSHVKAACRLMTLVSSTESDGNVQNSQLWRSLWDHVCDFGQPEDLAFDKDETTSKQFIKMFGKLFIDAAHTTTTTTTSSSTNSSTTTTSSSSSSTTPSNTIHRSESMILKFVGLAERIMNNRPVRNSRSTARFSAVTSAAEREYILALEGIAIVPDKAGLENIQTEIVRVFERIISQETQSPAFIRRCCEAIQTVYAASEIASRAGLFVSLYTTLTELYSASPPESSAKLNTIVHQTLLEVVKHGLPSLTPSSGVSETMVSIAWDKILKELRHVVEQKVPGAECEQQVSLLGAVMAHALPLLQSKAVSSSVQDDLVSILDHGSSSGLSTPLQEACTQHLFNMMQWEHGGTGGSGAAAVAPVVLRRCTKTLRGFVQKSQEGNTGTNAEVLKVLEQLQELRIRPADADAGASAGSGRGDQSHLLQLFPVLCDCVAALGASPEEKEISSKLAVLFRTVGSVVGVGAE